MLNPLQDLTFPNVFLGKKKTPWNLRALIYKGGAALRIDEAERLIDAGTLGEPILERFDLVQRIHEEIRAALTGGASRFTALSCIEDFRRFYRWADASGHSLNIEAIESTFLAWSDHMVNRVRVIRDITETSAYGQVRMVGSVLDKVLERRSPIVLRTRLFKQPKKKRVRGVQADKQNLTETFEFGHALLDIVDGMPIEAIWGALPLRIKLRNGKELEEWSTRIAPEKLAKLDPLSRQHRYRKMRIERNRAVYEKNLTPLARYPLINLRIESELLLFIGVTGMNLSQAHKLKVRHYNYKSTIDGYEVRDFKKRRQGEVLFEIYGEYKEVFERYLNWRNIIFKDGEEALFPLIRRWRSEDTPPKFSRLRASCKKLGLRFIPPSQLRNTRINWMLRYSTDPDLTSLQAQHKKETLLRVYEEPNLQVAMVEVTKFWQKHDPALPSPGPGVCDGSPVPLIGTPPGEPTPDCICPTGCLWCEHHRDIDSQDYVWSIASMRHLKILAAKGFGPLEGGINSTGYRVQIAIERLTAKLGWFRSSNEVRRAWVDEALARINEAFYHPYWRNIITAIEDD